MVCVLGLVEAGLLLHARTVAVSAALTGSKTQAAYGAGSGDGLRAAAQVATAGGLSAVTVTVSTSSAGVAVRVDGQAPTMIGLVAPHVHAESISPWEVP